MRFNLLLIAVSLCIFSLTSAAVYADRYPTSEVQKLIKETEEKLESVKSEGAESYAPKEVTRIEDYIKEAKKQLEENERDIAYYEINKAMAFFKLISAKKELLDAETSLKNIQDIKNNLR